jgi:hypothetical protein
MPPKARRARSVETEREQTPAAARAAAREAARAAVEAERAEAARAEAARAAAEAERAVAARRGKAPTPPAVAVVEAAATPAAVTPAPATTHTPTQGKETGVDRWFEALGGEDERGSVTPPERAASEVTRSVADGIVRSVRDALVSRPGGLAPVVQLEDRSSNMERNLRANLTSMAGTVEAPFLGGELWEAVRGGTATAAMREVVRSIKARSPQHQLLVEVFEDAGRGVVPACLVGETQEKKMARWGARIVLLEMAMRVTRVILEAQYGRGAETDRAIDAMDAVAREAGHASFARSVMIATSGANARLFQEEGRGWGGGQNSGRGRGGRGGHPVVCHNCGQYGHIKANCRAPRK